MNEKETRQILIDSLLVRSGWGLSDKKLIQEYLLKNLDNPKALGLADYVLLDKFNKPLAVIEAKKTSRDALAGKRQAEEYAAIIEKQTGFYPFIFLTNGIEIYFWEKGRYPERKISGFYSRNDLERLAFQREYSILLSQVELNDKIANRAYQKEAIRIVTEGIDSAKRKFLLVMATGTGKTRTVVSIIELLLRAKRVQKVLFLADRRELVNQAIDAMKTFLPNESISRIELGEISHGSRIHITTYQSMMLVYSQISIGYYDLVIADESHRSIYNRYRAIFERFDAIYLGLTATPTDYIDHNTFQLFECTDGEPSYSYTYENAVQEKYLVDYKVYHARTEFQIEGIHGKQLSLSLQDSLKDTGFDPEEIDFEGMDIERKVSNSGTNDAIIKEFMERCRKDILGIPHKSIIFAISHFHAKGLYESFKKLYPDYANRGMFEIIDSHMERVELTLSDFKTKDMPRIAISVDMLDTGIDIPSIQNLVFAKPVFSRVKFWQMIGRGTRLHTYKESNEVKKDFLIMDFWNNFEYFQLKPEGEIATSTEPLPVKLFRLRLDKYNLLKSNNLNYDKTVFDIQNMLQSLPEENSNIMVHREKIVHLIDTWNEQDIDLNYLNHSIAPLMRYYYELSLDEIQFRALVERAYIAWLKKDTAELIIASERIKENLMQLATSIKEVKAVEEKRIFMLSFGFWENLSQERLEDLQETFAPLMRFKQSSKTNMIQLDLPDQIKDRRWIIFGPTGEGAFVETYREKLEARIKQLTNTVIPLQKIQSGLELSKDDLIELENKLNESDLYITENILKQVYEKPEANLQDFIKHILNISKLPSWEETIQKEFKTFIQKHNFTSSQYNYLRALKSALIANAKITREDFEKPPLSRVGKVKILFTEDELNEILEFTSKLEKVA